MISVVAAFAFWAAAILLILRNGSSPTQIDIHFVRFGYLPILILANLLTHAIWHWRGVE